MYFRIFDCWRFVAAMLVMSYHYLYFAPGDDAISGTAYLHRLLPLLDMFFMISGFLIASRYASSVSTPAEYARFLRRRIARVYPLHLLTLAFFVAVAWAGAAGLVTLRDPVRWDFSALPFHILAVHAWGTTEALGFNYPSWSVSAEIFCYILFPVVMVIFRRAGLRGLLALLAVWVAALEILSRQGAFPSGHWTDADTMGAYRAFADFTAGAVAAALVARRRIDVRSHLPGLAALAVAVYAMLSQQSVYLSLAALFAAIVLIGLSETARPSSTAWLQPLMRLTRVSFGIYILHSVLETLFLSIVWNRLLEPTGLVGFYVFWLVPMAATIALALLSDRFVEGRLGRLMAGIPAPSGAKSRMASA